MTTTDEQLNWLKAKNANIRSYKLRAKSYRYYDAIVRIP